jgi:hypothetical protein
LQAAIRNAARANGRGARGGELIKLSGSPVIDEGTQALYPALHYGWATARRNYKMVSAMPSATVFLDALLAPLPIGQEIF